MNKLLQHIMNAGGVSDKFLVHYNNGVPLTKKPLVKAQRGIEYVTVDGKRMRTDSPEYRDVYQKGIGRWVGDEFVSSTKTLPEVVVTSKIKKNSLGDYSNTFYKQNPFETFYNNRYDEIKRDFTSEPRWAQISVGGWDKESRQEKVRQQIKDEYQNKFNEYVSQRLLSRSPQNNQSRNQWLSNKNFSNRELDILTTGSGSKLPQPNLYAQGVQGLYNTADMLTFGKLPELAVPGVAESEVANYNNPLLTLAPLSVPAKMVQSAYRNNYSFSDALAGKPNDASLAEDIITDPFTWATLGGKSTLTAANRLGRLASKYMPTPRRFFNAANPVLNESASLTERATAAAETINSEGSRIIDRLRSPEGMRRMREMFKKADPNLTDEQLEYTIENRLREMETARDFSWPKMYLEFGDKPAFNKYLGDIQGKIFPKSNAHFSPENVSPIAPQPSSAPKNMVSETFTQPPTELVIDPKTGTIEWTKSLKNIRKPHAYESFVSPHFDPGQIALGKGLELNKNVAAHEFMHALQGSGVTPVDEELRSLIKVNNPFDKIWNVAARVDPELRRDFRYFQKGSGRKEPYPFMEELRTRMLNRGIISDAYENITPGKLFRARLDALKQGDTNFKEGTRLIKFVAPWKYGKLADIMNNAPAIIPGVGIGAAALAGSSDTENNQQFKKGGPIVDPFGQWAHPGKRTIVPTSDGRITMKDVSYPVYGEDETGYGQMMYPGGEYQFPGQIVDEIPMVGQMMNGGQLRKFQGDKAGSTTGQPDIAAAKQFLTDWNNSPMAKQMLYNSVDKDDPVGINSIYADRLRTARNTLLNQTQVNVSNFKDFNNTLKKNNMKQASNPGVGTAAFTYQNKGISFWNTPNHIDGYIKNPMAVFDYFNSKDNSKTEEGKNHMYYQASNIIPRNNFSIEMHNEADPVSLHRTLIHELDHAANAQGHFIPRSDIDKMVEYAHLDNRGKVKTLSSYQGYLADPTETKARLAELRYASKQQKLYDPFTQKATMKVIQDYKYPKNDGYDPLKALKEVYTDEQILDMLNSISKAPNTSGIPLAKSGGQHGGLDRWFAEKWVDVKTGKACGRQEGESRAYPACRPSRRVSSQTPKTSSEMSPAEKARFKKTKTSSERIPYNHKKAQWGIQVSQQDSARNMASKSMDYEFDRGSQFGTGLSNYGNPALGSNPTKQQAVDWYMANIYPKTTPYFKTAMEQSEAGDFIYNAGRDPRIYMLDQYMKSVGQKDGIPNRGSFNIDMNRDPQGWTKKKPELDALWNQYYPAISKLSVNDRRVLLNKGRDFYYQNINKKADGSPSDAYFNTWYGRIWNTNDYAPYIPNNPKFKKK